MKTLVLNLQKYLVLRLNLVVYTLGFAIPFLFSHPQLLTGTIVNSLLFVSSEKMKRRDLYPILVLPSLGAVSHGVLFGPQTIFLVYFLPFIWLGNYVQAVLFSFTKGQSYPVRVLLAAIAKYLLLYLSANTYFRLHLVPKLFVTSMGLSQLITACLGGLLAFFLLLFLKSHD